MCRPWPSFARWLMVLANSAFFFQSGTGFHVLFVTRNTLRAERKAGQMLADMPKNQGAILGKTGNKGLPVLDTTFTLLTDGQSKSAQSRTRLRGSLVTPSQQRPSPCHWPRVGLRHQVASSGQFRRLFLGFLSSSGHRGHVLSYFYLSQALRQFP